MPAVVDILATVAGTLAVAIVVGVGIGFITWKIKARKIRKAAQKQFEAEDIKLITEKEGYKNGIQKEKEISSERGSTSNQSFTGRARQDKVYPVNISGATDIPISKLHRIEETDRSSTKDIPEPRRIKRRRRGI